MRILNGDEWSAISQAQFLTEQLASPDNLRISEINYHPHNARPELGELDVADRNFEFLEFQNISNADINLDGARLVQIDVGGEVDGVTYQFGATTLAPNESVIVVRDRASFESRYGTAGIRFAAGSSLDNIEGQWGGGSLGDGGETVTLLAADGSIIHQVAYSDDGIWPEVADGGGASLELIDPLGDLNAGANYRASWTFGGTPGAENVAQSPRVVINEVLSNSDAPIVDQIELHNVTNSVVDVSHWYVTDSDRDIERFRIPAGTTIAAGGYLVFDQNQLGFGFRGQDSDNALLVSATSTGTLLGFEDAVTFDASDPDRSLGRWPNASGILVPQTLSTLGADNAGPLLLDAIISEVHYNSGSNDEVLEFVEISNVGASLLDVSGWRLNNAVEFTLPAGTNIGAGASLVVVPFDPSDADQVQVFSAEYGNVSPRLFGPYDGTLDNGGERLEWQRPVGNDVAGFILADVVRYDDDVPWPSAADGIGSSLQRRLGTFGNDVNSWLVGSPSPGTATVAGPTFDLNGDAVVDVNDIDHLCQAMAANDIASDLNGDGLVDQADLLQLVEIGLNSVIGDSNLDGIFGSGDLVAIFQAGEYEDGIPGNSNWTTGDWNCDGEFDSSDLVTAFVRGSYTAAARPGSTGLADNLATVAASIDGVARPLAESSHQERTRADDAVSTDATPRRELEPQAVERLFGGRDT